MLKKLILENWKSFRYAELPIDPLTILIGANASGKSNVVDALEFLQRTVVGKEIEATLAGDSTLSSIRGGVEWAALKPETQFTLKALIQGEDERTDYLYSITVQIKPFVQVLEEFLIHKSNLLDAHDSPQENYLVYKNQSDDSEEIIKIKGTANDTIRRHFFSNKSILNWIKSIDFSDFSNKISTEIEINAEINVVIQSNENIFILNPIPYKMRDYSRLSEKIESDASNIAGVLAALSDEQKVEFESTVSAYAKHLPERDIQRVWAEPVGRFGTDAMLYCEEQWKSGETLEIDARGMSDGTLRFLAILTALLTRPEGSQLVIEDVDDGLHPSRVGLLLRMLREIGEKRKIDILVTTHNPALLDALDPEMVPFVVVAHRDSGTGESKLTLLEDINNFPKLFASASLGRLTTKGAIERSLSDTK